MYQLIPQSQLHRNTSKRRGYSTGLKKKPSPYTTMPEVAVCGGMAVIETGRHKLYREQCFLSLRSSMLYSLVTRGGLSFREHGSVVVYSFLPGRRIRAFASTCAVQPPADSKGADWKETVG